jgi:hypothetical protein
MHRLIVPSIAAGVAVVLTLAVTSMTSTAAGTSYAEDRAAIEDLQARYLFAMDFGDPGSLRDNLHRGRHPRCRLW